jgi:hypothetical protein
LALSSSSCAYLSITLGIKIKFSEFFSFPNWKWNLTEKSAKIFRCSVTVFLILAKG